MYLVGFSTPRAWNPLSALIRMMTKSCTSHAFLVFDDPVLDVRLVLEAGLSGYDLLGFDQFVATNRIVALAHSAPSAPAGVRLLGASVEEGLRSATGRWLGSRFDYAGLVGIFLVILRGYFSKRRWRNPFRTSKQLYCSEAVIRTLKAGGHPCVAGLDPEMVGPQELLEILSRDPGTSLRLGDVKPAPRTKVQRAETRAYVEKFFA